jgi:putative ABC transport system ATP-binding protein
LQTWLAGLRQVARRKEDCHMGAIREALHTTTLRKTFDGDTVPIRALRGVDLSVGEGEFVAIIGPSGCGKSTLLSLIAGLDKPSGGEVVVAGVPLAGKGESDLARVRRAHIGLVFQFYNLLADTPALEQVALAAALAGASHKEAESRGRELLGLLGLADKTRQSPGALSGGERQRLAIARALANHPTLLLADEPTGALDSESAAEVLELFRRLHTGGQTILLVTHDAAVAAAAQRTVRMRDGQLEDDVAARPAAPAGFSGSR